MATTWAERDDEYLDEESYYSEEEEEFDTAAEQWENADVVMETITDNDGNKFEITKKVLKTHVTREITPADLRARFAPYGKAVAYMKEKESSPSKPEPPYYIELGNVDEFNAEARTKVNNAIREFANAEVNVKDSRFARIKIEDEQRKRQKPREQNDDDVGESWADSRNRGHVSAVEGANDYKKKIRVSNLNDNITEDNLKEVFSFRGEVTVKRVFIVRDKQTGQCKGFGFITYDSEKDANFAIKKNSVNYKNSTIRISKAEPHGK